MFILVLFAGIHVSALSSSKTPGAQFDLTKWKITLPDSKASEKSPSQLEGGYTSKYFYTASDGAMAFYVPGNGGRTENAKYPRSEFRQLCKPSASGNPDRYNWKVSSGNYIVSAKYKIGKIDSSSRKIVIQQIHAYDGPPLIKMKWEKGKVYALVKTDTSGNNEKSYLMGSAPQNKQFLLKTQVQNGYLKLYFNNVRKYNIKVKSYWSKYGNYFKAGNYLQSNSGSAYAYVYIYYLQLTHSGSCSYTSDTFMFEDDADNAESMSVSTIIGISCIVLFAVFICCGVAGYCLYNNNKKKKLKKQIDELEENSKEDGDVGDTPMIGTGETNEENQTPAYDMEEIEIDVEVESVEEDTAENQV